MDFAEAARWYRLAADQGSGLAQLNLGMFYHEGQGGLPKDPVQAYVWISLAAGRGEQDALHWRDMLARTLAPAELAEAQKLIGAWKPIKPPA